MAFKIQRNFDLRVEYKQNGESLFQVIRMPQTVQFSIARNALFALNEATFKIYNLSPETRSKLRHDYWDNTNITRVLFNAGYQENLFTCFSGVVISAQSYRSGSDFITEIIALDGGNITIQNFFSGTYRKGQFKQEVLDQLINSFEQYGVRRGAISNIEGKFETDKSVSGNALWLLNELTENGVYIDQMRINYVRDNQYIRASIAELNSSTGLLETPRVGLRQVEATMLFEPSILVGQQLKLDSQEASPSVLASFKGEYKVSAVYHAGVISGAVGGPCSTIVVLNNFSAIEGKQELIIDG